MADGDLKFSIKTLLDAHKIKNQLKYINVLLTDDDNRLSIL